MNHPILRSLTTILVLTITGCAPRSASDGDGNTTPVQDDRQAITNNLRASLREFAIAERQAIDSARNAEQAGFSLRAGVDDTYTMYRDSWEEMFALIRSEKLSGTRRWTAAEKEELISYALLQRRQLQLAELSIEISP
ncbi:MAG: hypothetical protein ABII82_16795 [Verrucomicrobiota bacterium]